MKDNDQLLRGQAKPTVEQASWVISHLLDSMVHGGTFRYLIYDRMGYGPEAYMPMLEAGAMTINNAFCDLESYREKELERSSHERFDGSEWEIDGLMLQITEKAKTLGHTKDVS